MCVEYNKYNGEYILENALVTGPEVDGFFHQLAGFSTLQESVIS